jgi:beta-lactamase class A
MSTSTENTELNERIAERATEFSGQFGMFAKNLETGEEVGVNADAVMPTASVIKVAVLAELYRQVETGKVSLEERREVTPDDWWGGSGVLKEFAPGLTPTVNDLARMMIIVSDNVATGMLVRLLGKDAINASLREWGLPETTLVWQMTLGDDIRNFAVSTPRELARLMELIATDAIVSREACAAMRDHLSRQQYLDQIPRYLPYNPYARYVGADDSMQVFNKTGFYTGVRADAAIVAALDCRFVIATMTEGSTDPSFRMDHEGNLLNGAAAQFVYEAWRR